jgi:hypothetical protein
MIQTDEMRRTGLNLPVHRRHLMTIGFGGLYGLTLPRLLRAEAARSAVGPTPRVKSVIFLHQWGGPSHIDTFDMKPDAPANMRGEFDPIASSIPGTTICEHLPRFSKVLHRFAQVRTMHHRMKNHNAAGYYSLSGHVPPLDDQRLRDSQELFPAMGSVVSRFRPVDDPALPTFVSYPHKIADGSQTPGQFASFLGKAHDPFYVGQDPNSPDFRLPELSLPETMPLGRLDDRRELVRLIDRQARLLETSAAAGGIDRFQDRAMAMLTSPNLKHAFDLSQEPAALRDSYGRHTYGQSCLLARRLVESGVRFVTVYFARSIGNGGKGGAGGWDTHKQNFSDLKDRLLPMTDQTVPTLIEDMAARGMLKDTLVVWTGEMGRAPKIGDQDPQGRGHWPMCYTALLAGGGVKGGMIYGASDKTGAFPTTAPTRPDDLSATIFRSLGIDPASEMIDTLGRPLPASTGQSIDELFA